MTTTKLPPIAILTREHQNPQQTCIQLTTLMTKTQARILKEQGILHDALIIQIVRQLEKLNLDPDTDASVVLDMTTQPLPTHLKLIPPTED